jgi:hypothetical protein
MSWLEYQSEACNNMATVCFRMFKMASVGSFNAGRILQMMDVSLGLTLLYPSSIISL